MGLIDNDRVVFAQPGVTLRFCQQDAIGHQLDRRPWLKAILEPNLVAHMFPGRRTQFLGNPLGDRYCSNPPGLGMTNSPRLPSSSQGADFGELRGFA